MSLPDSAEYWWDVKKPNFYNGKMWVHFNNSPCGHYKPQTMNCDTSNYIDEVTCPACLKLLNSNGNIYNLQNTNPKKCECGSIMQVRINKKTSEKFLGCSNYPNCKKTRKL
ncbi:MAG: topoisomerase DNA-binding C4 zinc finger domain-containing protein [Bergeyella sp.]